MNKETTQSKEALKCLEILGDFYWHDKPYREQFADLFATIKNYILKAQEKEKLLESGDLSDGSYTHNELHSLICQISAALAEKIQECNEYKEVMDIIKKKPNVVMAVKRYTTYGNFKANNMTSDISHEEFELVKRHM